MNTPLNENRLAYNVEEAAAIIGIGRTRLYQAIKSGALKARKYGKRTIILHSDLLDFLTNLKYFPAQQAEE